MNNISPNEETASKFNYAQDILERVGYLQFEAIKAYDKGDLDGWFFKFRNIKYQLAGKFTKSDLKKLAELESKINLLIGLRKKNNNKERTTSMLVLLIESYINYIQSKIEEWEMGLVGKKNDTTFA